MKNSIKGFFLAETIVMIALVSTVMAFVYPNLTKLYDNFNNRTKYYDQPEDLYTLKAYSKLLEEEIKKETEDKTKDSDEDGFGCLKFTTNNYKDLTKKYLTSPSLKFGDISKLYLTGYMTDLSADDYDFNKYLKRLKKTTYDSASYRLIGIFQKGGEERYASIKIENPNPNRNCNLGG